MTSKLGVYWSVAHRRPQDYEFFRKLNPSVMKVMDGGDVDYKWIRDNLPDSLVVARIHALSEQHDDMLKDPEGTGRRHADEWSHHATRLGFDRAKTLILGINEPRVWEPGVPEALRQYTIALCQRASALALRVGAMQLSVGWPNNTGPDTPPDWSPWDGVDNAIRANNGALVCHEYWADNGPGENWGWWAGRVLKCPWQVPIVIGECGIDMYVKDGSVERHKRGWRGRKEPERYAGELAEYTGRMSGDSRFVGDCVFASDFASQDWFSFDIEPAYQAILLAPIASYPPDTPPSTVHIPSVGTGKPTSTPAYIVAPAGANLRSAPITGQVIIAIPYAEEIRILGVMDTSGWLKVRYRDQEGYMAASLVGLVAPEPLPAPSEGPQPVEPPSDNWERSLAFIRKWEGGWADDPNDPGGATNKGITLGTYTRWRQVRGQPAPTKDDLRALTDAEANRIYDTFYWRESGADKLPWPLCLAHFDTAVNAGTGRAQEMLQRSAGSFLAYMSHLITWYASIDGFQHFGRAWMKRRADILLEASK